ncbi:hypothetical protein G0Q06_00265 [Puniceicoccales bacterium CK1056]|uniref:Uncharacterized protein n=1 Tax=Oceanipulchritudo coccoides TaxID=2706888 RepID=A0A6B2LXX8_9BACT|nr:hypothetical protein [Oceanipulchritudo coccoides]NDV60879.1 hypothetical protein [Oceanipulchritudo coccoides]
MTCSLKWYRRNEFGKRQQIEFKLIREKPEWKIHRERHEPREVYEPDEQDWDDLLDFMARQLNRGKVYPKDLEIVQRLKERALE